MANTPGTITLAETNATGTTTTPSQTEQVKSKPAVDAEKRTAQHTYRPIPQGFMGYGSSGAWD